MIFSRLLLPILLLCTTADAATITIGSDLGWTDGICYRPISSTRAGDVLTFNYAAHDVWRLPSEDAMDSCDFSSGTKLATVGDAPFEYTITEQDALLGSLHFACSVGAHCTQGRQRLTVDIEQAPSNEPEEERAVIPTSQYALGLNENVCSLYQSGTTNADDTAEFLESNRLQSECTDAVFDNEDGMYHVSCLSGPATLTPGGVMNSARIMHYPYPTDRRVIIGTNTWEFVQGDPVPNSGGLGVTPVPVNQLYVHHLSGRTVLGQGSEGIRRSDVQIPFPEPYGTLTGDEGDAMIFHIIDLREVDEWLACVECRCRDPDLGTYLDFLPGEETGGVSCCSNCTNLEGPTVDYRMRYNVSYSDVPEDRTMTNLQMLTADISPAVGKAIEFDIPSYQYLKADNIKEGMPRTQRLEREGPFNELFKMEFFGDDYAGPSTVRFLRCVGHLHIAALGMWLMDAETGQVICNGEGSYGQNAEEDKGFLTAIKVHSHDPPLEFPADRRVKLITEYNATEFHTGVMGMWFAFVSSDVKIDREAAALTVSYCEDNVCDANMLPEPPMLTCEDTLASNPMCRFGGLCECEELVVADGSEGCGGIYSTPQGDIEINNVCAEHCDACGMEVAGGDAGGCIDALADSPLCRFGGLCSCEEFVNSPDSTGCGGVYTSEFGDSPVNDYCAKHCDACPEEENEGPSQDELLQKEILNTMEDYLAKQCVFATPDCKKTLSNLHSCSSNRYASFNIQDQNMRAVVEEHGVRLAAEHSKLGSASLHRNEEDATVAPCEVNAAVEEASGEDTQGNPKLFGALVVAFTFAVLIVGMLYVRYTKKPNGEEEVTVEKAVEIGDTKRTLADTTPRGSSDGSSDDASEEGSMNNV